MKGLIVTQYGVAFDAPEAPAFRLTGRMPGSEQPIIDTGNPKFDAIVSIHTEADDVEELTRFLTPARRAAILRLLAFWPTTEILNTEAYIRSEGIENDAARLTDSICHLVAAAETFDRLEEPEAATASSSNDHSASIDGGGEAGGVLTDVRLAEAAVLADLFNSDLEKEEMLTRFEETYTNKTVAWSGEVMRIGSYDAQGRVQVVLLIGSADGENPESGRVFATTAVPSDPYLAEGKVLNFEGTLAALDTEQRLFRLHPIAA